MIDLINSFPEDIVVYRFLPFLGVHELARFEMSVGSGRAQHALKSFFDGHNVKMLLVSADTRPIRWINKWRVQVSEIVFLPKAGKKSLDELLAGRILSSCADQKVSMSAGKHEEIVKILQQRIESKATSKDKKMLVILLLLRMMQHTLRNISTKQAPHFKKFIKLS